MKIDEIFETLLLKFKSNYEDIEEEYSNAVKSFIQIANVISNCECDCSHWISHYNVLILLNKQNNLIKKMISKLDQNQLLYKREAFKNEIVVKVNEMLINKFQILRNVRSEDFETIIKISEFNSNINRVRDDGDSNNILNSINYSNSKIDFSNISNNIKEDKVKEDFSNEVKDNIENRLVYHKISKTHNSSININSNSNNTNIMSSFLNVKKNNSNNIKLDYNNLIANDNSTNIDNDIIKEVSSNSLINSNLIYINNANENNDLNNNINKNKPIKSLSIKEVISKFILGECCLIQKNGLLKFEYYNTSQDILNEAYNNNMLFTNTFGNSDFNNTYTKKIDNNKIPVADNSNDIENYYNQKIKSIDSEMNSNSISNNSPDKAIIINNANNAINKKAYNMCYFNNTTKANSFISPKTEFINNNSNFNNTDSRNNNNNSCFNYTDSSSKIFKSNLVSNESRNNIKKHSTKITKNNILSNSNSNNSLVNKGNNSIKKDSLKLVNSINKLPLKNIPKLSNNKSSITNINNNYMNTNTADLKSHSKIKNIKSLNNSSNKQDKHDKLNNQKIPTQGKYSKNYQIESRLYNPKQKKVSENQLDACNSAITNSNCNPLTKSMANLNSARFPKQSSKKLLNNKSEGLLKGTDKNIINNKNKLNNGKNNNINQSNKNDNINSHKTINTQSHSNLNSYFNNNTNTKSNINNNSLKNKNHYINTIDINLSNDDLTNSNKNTTTTGNLKSNYNNKKLITPKYKLSNTTNNKYTKTPFHNYNSNLKNKNSKSNVQNQDSFNNDLNSKSTILNTNTSINNIHSNNKFLNNKNTSLEKNSLFNKTVYQHKKQKFPNFRNSRSAFKDSFLDNSNNSLILNSTTLDMKKKESEINKDFDKLITNTYNDISLIQENIDIERADSILFESIKHKKSSEFIGRIRKNNKSKIDEEFLNLAYNKKSSNLNNINGNSNNNINDYNKILRKSNKQVVSNNDIVKVKNGEIEDLHDGVILSNHVKNNSIKNILKNTTHSVDKINRICVTPCMNFSNKNNKNEYSEDNMMKEFFKELSLTPKSNETKDNTSINNRSNNEINGNINNISSNQDKKDNKNVYMRKKVGF